MILPAQKHRLEIGSGIDATKVACAKTNIARLIEHDTRFRRDFEMIAEAGVKFLRIPIWWDEVEAEPEVYNWSLMDAIMHSLRELGITVMLDPLHHNLLPDWLENGYLDPEFPARYTKFVQLCLERYRWIPEVTPINEPLTNALMCGHMGRWYPYHRSEKSFVAMLTNITKAVCMVTDMVTRTFPHVRIVRVDTCEYHQVRDPEVDKDSFRTVAHLNERRFLADDLCFGKVDDSHPLREYLDENGFTEHDAEWLRHNRATIHTLGIDPYLFHDMDWSDNAPGLIRPSQKPIGLAALSAQYWDRYQTDVEDMMITEFNLRGYHTDRISAMKYAAEQALFAITNGVPITRLYLYPAIDPTCWTTECNSIPDNDCDRLDPHGMMFYRGPGNERNWSEMTEYVSYLASGGHPDGIRPYRFRGHLGDPSQPGNLCGYIEHHMNHWDWQVHKEPTLTAVLNEAA
jgi:hypothetical protein